MTPNRLATIAFRCCSISAMFTLWLFAPNAQAQSAATVINGVYNGTYTCAIGPRTLKLSLLASGNGSLTGVFTFYLPPTSHTQAFSYSLNGTFDAASGKFKLNPVKWETPPPGGYSMVGMDGAFDPGTGQVAGKITYGSCGAFQATRDQAKSANMTSIIAPQASAAGTQATRQTNAQPATPPGQPSATSMTGVYIGTYTCKGGPSKLKVSLIGAPDDTLAGFFTIDLPYDGPRFTYKLTGRYAWGAHEFLLTSVPWGPEPPADYSMSRLTGKYYPGSDLLRGYVTSAFCSDFWGKLDKSESPESIAAAMRTPPVPSPSRPQAPAEPSAAEIKAALPPPAPPNGLVRKSKAYWGDYRSDIIRQVFDGGFGYDVDESAQFQILFTSYVESFSKNCHTYLPANHEAVAITRVTTKTDRYGNVASQQEGQSATVDVDSRFAPKYRKYGESLTSSQQSLGAALGIMSGRVSAGAYFDPGTDMIKFFQTEKCQSAAIRQLGENLLRGATGKRSLQQDGATIAGAAAETDKSLPPGRFARFVDGCNAFYRDPANSKYYSRNATAWCECLSDQYRGVMTPEEESRYANDFKRLFLDQIAQPQRNSTDPEWQRLHPARDRCAQ
jgi:hypothetical protein